MTIKRLRYNGWYMGDIREGDKPLNHIELGWEETKNLTQFISYNGEGDPHMLLMVWEEKEVLLFWELEELEVD